MEPKELMNLGAGALLLLKEKIEEELERVGEKGREQKEGLMDFVQKAKEKGSSEEERLRSEIRQMLRESLEELGLATKADIDSLKEMIAKLHA